MTHNVGSLFDSLGGPPRLHHVGIVVGDLEAAVARYRALGFGPGERFELPEQRVVAVTFAAGPGWTELIAPTDPDGPIARFHAKRGDGLHHVAYAVPDLEATLARLAAAGLRLIDPTPRAGTHGWRIAFLHPESCNGVLTELVEDGVGSPWSVDERAKSVAPSWRRPGRGIGLRIRSAAPAPPGLKAPG